MRYLATLLIILLPSAAFAVDTLAVDRDGVTTPTALSFLSDVTAPSFVSNATDGGHYVDCSNSSAMTTTGWSGTQEGRWCYDKTLHKFRYWNGSALADLGTGGGTWGSITGTLSAQTDLNTALGLKAPLASPAFTGTVTLPVTGSGNQCLRVSSTGIVSGTGSDCGTGSGSGSGTVNSSSSAYHLAGYATTGTTVSDSGITYSSDGSTLTTAQGASPEFVTLRSGTTIGSANKRGWSYPASAAASDLLFDLPTADPTAGQVMVCAAPSAGHSVCTWAANGSGGTWGSITGTLSAQSDLNTALGTKQANLGLTSVSGNTTKVATTSGTLTQSKQATFDATGNLVASSYDVGNATGITSIGTSTPTTLTGLIKGNGSVTSAASAGTDYVAPGGTHRSGFTVAVSNAHGLTTDEMSGYVISNYGMSNGTTTNIYFPPNTSMTAGGYSGVFVIDTLTTTGTWSINRYIGDSTTDICLNGTCGKTSISESNQPVGSRLACFNSQTGSGAYARWNCQSISGTWN